MMACALRFSAGALVVLLCGLLQTRAASPEEIRATIVVYNVNDPSSGKLAQYYAQRRQIPLDHVIGLNCPITEEISREEYEATIAGPLRKIFTSNGWWRVEKDSGNASHFVETKISFVALMRGMPLKIRGIIENPPPPAPNQPPAVGNRNEASVDSELSCLTLNTYSPAGIIQNPYYRRFTPILQANAEIGILLVCRLDAPTEITVRAMIDDSLAAEKTGLWGWAYVDSRGPQTEGYAEGEEWLATLTDAMRKAGIPVLLDTAPEILPAGYPATDAAIYFGWYSDRVGGAFGDPAYRFRPGAVAVHIYSFSAASMRDAGAYWSAPLVERGAAATLGNVYEPYLTLTAHLDVFQDRLMAGFTFAESAYMSQRALSWMNVSIGDPLYRPYAAWQDLNAMLDNPSNWKRYRRIIEQAQGNVAAAAPDLKKASEETKDSMFLEALASAQVSAGKIPAALTSLQQAATLPASPDIRVRLVLEQVALLRTLDRKKEAGALILSMAGKTTMPQEQLLQSLYQKIFPPPPTPTPSPSPAKRP